jgi:hypothetical protein
LCTALDAQESDDAGRVLGAQLLQARHLARLQQLAHLGRRALADSLEVLQLLRRQLSQIRALRGDRLRCALVGPRAERLGIPLVEDGELGELTQHVEHVLFRIGHGGDVA